MKLGTIYYLIPDIFQRKFNLREFYRHLKRGEGSSYLHQCKHVNKRAIGGIKVFYQHCKQLTELGFDAVPLAMGNFDGNLYYPEIDSKHISEVGFNLNENDVVVATEFSPYDAIQFNHCKKVMFAQSWIYLKPRFKPEDQDKSYRQLGYDYVISCGEYISRTIRGLHNEECVTVSNGIDGSVFYPDEKLREPNRVMCMPRKNRDDIETIKSIVSRQCSNVTFVDVDGVPEAEIALAYRKSDILLSTGYPEGLPLPPLEAMCSGSVVVGFAGRGGRQYMIDGKTALVAEDGDCISAAEALVKVLNDRDLKELLRKNAQNEMQQYTLKAMQQRVGQFFKQVEADLN
ncbi:glycosyltransferase family 4 protein [Aliikangiella marina]|nr:glycosyltransferase family 4 protein [Aliikangiella marina]